MLRLIELQADWLTDRLMPEELGGFATRQAAITAVGKWVCLPVACQLAHPTPIQLVALNYASELVARLPIELLDASNQLISLGRDALEMEMGCSPTKHSLHFLSVKSGTACHVFLLEVAAELLETSQAIKAIQVIEIPLGEECVRVDWHQGEPATLYVLTSLSLRLYDVLRDCFQPALLLPLDRDITVVDGCFPAATLQSSPAQRLTLFLLDSSHRLYTLSPILYGGAILPLEQAVKLANKLQKVEFRPLPERLACVSAMPYILPRRLPVVGIMPAESARGAKMQIACIPATSRCFVAFQGAGPSAELELGVVTRLDRLLTYQSSQYSGLLRLGMGANSRLIPKCLRAPNNHCLVFNQSSVHSIDLSALMEFDGGRNCSNGNYEYRKLLQIHQPDKSASRILACTVCEDRCYLLLESMGKVGFKIYTIGSDGERPSQELPQAQDLIRPLRGAAQELERVLEQMKELQERINQHKNSIRTLETDMKRTLGPPQSTLKLRIQAVRENHRTILLKLSKRHTQPRRTCPAEEWNQYQAALLNLADSSQLLMASHGFLEAEQHSSDCSGAMRSCNQLLADIAKFKQWVCN